MAIYQIDIQKSLGTEYWTNVYHVEAPDRSQAIVYANDLVDFERSIHQIRVSIVSYRVAPYPGPSEGTVIPVGIFGQAPNDEYLPLFCVVRVDFPTPVGRPSRKYYRLPVAEAVQANGVFSAEFLTNFYSTVIAGLGGLLEGPLVDVDGQPLSDARVAANVGMRQLRRGSKRKLLPVIPVA